MDLLGLIESHLLEEPLPPGMGRGEDAITVFVRTMTSIMSDDGSMCRCVCVSQCQNNNHCWDSDTSLHIILQLCRCKHSSVDCQGHGEFRAIILSTRGKGSKWDEFDGRGHSGKDSEQRQRLKRGKLDAAVGQNKWGQRQRPKQDEFDAAARHRQASGQSGRDRLSSPAAQVALEREEVLTPR